MPAMNEIISISVSVSSTSVTRQGFGSIMIVGDETMVNTSVFTSQYMVKSYTSAASVGTDCTGDLMEMITMAFAQSPGINEVYVSYVDTSGTGAGIANEDLNEIAAINSDWFGYCSVFNTDADIVTQASWCAANKKYGSFLKTDSTNPNANSDYAILWHTKATDSTKWVQVAWLSNVLALTPGSYTGAFRQLQSATPNTYTKTEEDALRASAINQYSRVGGVPITWNGITSTGTEGHYADLYIGALYLEIRMQEDLVNLLVNNPKVAYTNDGLAQVQAVMNQRLDQSTTEGYLDANVPYSVSMPSIEGINRADRNLSGITFQATASGAIQSMEIQGTVDAT